jgi:hypothetical protein
MVARLGNVLHWAANAVAILPLVNGAIIGWSEFLHPTFGNYNAMTLSFVFAFGTWLLGRACLYVLAGANASQIQTAIGN